MISLANMFYNIISTIRGWAVRFVDFLDSSVGEVVDNLGWLKEFIIELALPDSILDAKMYVLLFGVGAFTFVFLAFVRMFRL